MNQDEYLTWLHLDGAMQAQMGELTTDPNTALRWNRLEDAGELRLNGGGLGLFALQFGEYLTVSSLYTTAASCRVLMSVLCDQPGSPCGLSAVTLRFSNQQVAKHRRCPFKRTGFDLFGVALANKATRRAIASDAALQAQIFESRASRRDKGVKPWRWVEFGAVRFLDTDPLVGTLHPQLYRGESVDGSLVEYILEFQNLLETSDLLDMSAQMKGKIGELGIDRGELADRADEDDEAIEREMEQMGAALERQGDEERRAREALMGEVNPEQFKPLSQSEMDAFTARVVGDPEVVARVVSEMHEYVAHIAGLTRIGQGAADRVERPPHPRARKKPG